MTQAAVTTWVKYIANGSQMVFAYPWKIAEASELEVYVNDLLSTNYTVSGVGSASGGNVTFLVAPPADAGLFIRRDTPETQETDYINNDPFGAETHEAALDKLTRMVQDIREDLSRRPALTTAVSNSLRHLTFPQGASKVIGWNSLGTGLQTYDLPGALSPTPPTLPGFPAPLVDVRAAPWFADPTGTDPADAILQDCMNELGAASGGVLWLPGVYKLTQTLTIPRGVSLWGVGSSGQAAASVWPENVYPSTLRWDGVAGGTMIALADHWAGRMQGLTLDGHSLAQFCLFLDRSPRGGLFEDLILWRTAAGGGGTGLYLGWPAAAADLFPPSSNIFRRLFFLDMGAKALILDGCAHNLFQNCAFSASADTTVLIVTPEPGTEGNDDNVFTGCGVIVGAGQFGVINNYPGNPEGGFLNNWSDCAFLGEATSTLLYAANNYGYSYYTRCYLFHDTPYLLDTGGKIQLQDCLFNTISGRPSASAITLTGSPFTYTNPGPFRLCLNVVGGTVSGLAHVRNGVTFGLSQGTILLDPGDALDVTYTDAPAITAIPF